MKLTLPANVPVTFYPTPGDDDRKRFSLMQPIGDITDERGGTVKAAYRRSRHRAAPFQ